MRQFKQAIIIALLIVISNVICDIMGKIGVSKVIAYPYIIVLSTLIVLTVFYYARRR